MDQARERYTPQRQRQAFAVSAHIFDLALQQEGWSPEEQLSLGFAAAIGYRRGGRDPNATAIMNRLQDLIVLDPPVADHAVTLPLEAGLASLGFQTRTLFTWFGTYSSSCCDGETRRGRLQCPSAGAVLPQASPLGVDGLWAWA